MTQDEFIAETKWLCNLYGKTLNEDQLQFWYDCLKNYDVKKYTRAIRQTAQTSKYMPNISEVLSLIKELKDYSEQNPKEKVPCKACKGTGYVFYKKTINGIEYDYVSQCNCPNSVGLDYDGRKMTDPSRRSEYYLAKATDVFKI